MTEITTDEYFGGCPECGKSDGYCNIGRSHWGSCDTHKTKWPIGESLFSCWKDETEKEWDENVKRLGTYKLVEPVTPKVANCDGQLTRAARTMRSIRGETEHVGRAKSLSQVREIAESRALIPGFEDTVERAQESGAWETIGALKRILLDDITRERNTFAKSVMGDVKEQRRERESAR